MILVGFFVLHLITNVYIPYKNPERVIPGFWRDVIGYPLGIIVLSYILCIFFGEIFTFIFILLIPVFQIILFLLAFAFSSYLPQPEPDPNAPRMPIQTPQPYYT